MIDIIQAGTYKIFSGEKSLEALSAYLSKDKFSSLFILTEENAMRHCMPVLVSKVPRLLEAEVIEIESGETSKNMEVCLQVWQALSELGADRQSLLVNLGGGVTTDMGGFIASVYKRGIRFVNLPTTLLSMVDASVGGKTGVDLGVLKNEIGVFADPQELYLYPEFLNSLPERQLISGYAEILKHGLIADRTYWNQASAVESDNSAELWKLVNRSVEIKNEIVLADPRENGPRKALNFGHTVGHAVESFFLEQQTKTVLHGEAVAAGMICELWISVQLCRFPEKEMESIVQVIGEHFMLPEWNIMDEPRILELMKHDKKNNKGAIRMALLKQVGEVQYDVEVKPELIIRSMEYYRKFISSL